MLRVQIGECMIGPEVRVQNSSQTRSSIKGPTVTYIVTMTVSLIVQPLAVVPGTLSL